MFVLLRAYELTSPSLSIAERIALTMERGGVSILFTSITDLVAFCVGAVSPLSHPINSFSHRLDIKNTHNLHESSIFTQSYA